MTTFITQARFHRNMRNLIEELIILIYRRNLIDTMFLIYWKGKNIKVCSENIQHINLDLEITNFFSVTTKELDEIPRDETRRSDASEITALIENKFESPDLEPPPRPSSMTSEKTRESLSEIYQKEIVYDDENAHTPLDSRMFDSVKTEQSEASISEETLTNILSDDLNDSFDDYSSDKIDPICGRYSPSTLQRRLAAELDLYEGVDAHFMQLESVENLRDVTLAKQESVSLAQILKSQEIQHTERMAELELKAQQHRYDSERSLAEAKIEHERKLLDVRNRSKEEALEEKHHLRENMRDIFKDQIERSSRLQV